MIKSIKPLQINSFPSLKTMVQKEKKSKDLPENLTLLQINLFSRFDELKPIFITDIKGVSPRVIFRPDDFLLHDGFKVIGYVVKGYVFKTDKLYC